MTGSPTALYTHTEIEPEQLWTYMLKADKSEFVMCASTGSMNDENVATEEMKAAGLVDGHAFALISVKEINLDAGGTVKLIKIRNPWGKKEWNGDWSDGSATWTAGTKAQVDFKEKNDGLFWISLYDYYKFFFVTSICYQCKKMNEISKSVVDTHGPEWFGLSKVVI